MSIHILLLFLITAVLAEARIVKVLNVFIPSYSISTYKQNSNSASFELTDDAITQQFNLGRDLYNTYKEDLDLDPLDTLSKIMYFTPADSLSVASGASQLLGIAAGELSMNEDKTHELLGNSSELEKTVVSTDESFLTIKLKNVPALRDNFRILPASLLLESGDFDCPFKQKYLGSRKNTVPQEIVEVYMKIAKKLSSSNKERKTPEELFELYQQLSSHQMSQRTSPEAFSNYSLRTLEYISSIYALYAYHDDDILQKLDSGNLIRKLFMEMNIDSGYKIMSFGVHHSTFASLLSVFDIINWKRMISYYDDEAREGRLYPKPGSNLIIEVHLDENRVLSIAVKYNDKHYTVCQDPIADTKNCDIRKAYRYYSAYEIKSAEGFRKICLSTTTTQVQDTQTVERFKWESLVYCFGLLFVIYAGYRICMKIITIMATFQNEKEYANADEGKGDEMQPEVTIEADSSPKEDNDEGHINI